MNRGFFPSFMLTVSQARKILGKPAKTMSDEDIVTYIESASLLKDLFFQDYLKSKKKLLERRKKIVS